MLVSFLITNIWWHDVDRGAPGRGKRSWSVQEDNGTLDVQCQVSSWHSARLRVIDLCCRRRWKSKDATPGASTWVPGSGFIICIRQFMLKFRSLYRDLHLHHQDCSGYPDHDIHPLAHYRGIEFIFIGINPWPRFLWRLPRDRDQRLWGTHGRRLPYLHGGPEWWSVI
jgi:hypothetical protein